jgi:hypothetical protein
VTPVLQVMTAQSVLSELAAARAAVPDPGDLPTPNQQRAATERRRVLDAAATEISNKEQLRANVESRCRPWLASRDAMREVRSLVSADIAALIDGDGVDRLAPGAFGPLVRRHAGGMVIAHAFPLPVLEQQAVEAVSAIAAAEAAVAAAVAHGQSVIARN